DPRGALLTFGAHLPKPSCPRQRASRAAIPVPADLGPRFRGGDEERAAGTSAGYYHWLFCGYRLAVAPGGELVPALGFHELGPAAVEVAEIVLARFRLGDVHHRARDAQALGLVILDLVAEA